MVKINKCDLKTFYMGSNMSQGSEHSVEHVKLMQWMPEGEITVSPD